MASRPSHRDAGQQRAEKYKERLKSNVKAAPTFVDTISACQCHNAGINTCTICRRPPHARADVAPDALTTLVKRTTQKPWVLPAELVKAAVDRIQCATCRVAVQHRIIQLSQAGGIQFQGLRWRSAKALVPARSNGTDRNALALLARLSSDGAMSPTLVSNIVNFYYLEQPRVEAVALAGVKRMLDSLGKKWHSAHNSRGSAGSARKMTIGSSSSISDDFEVAWFQALEKLVQARTLMFKSVWSHIDFRPGQTLVDMKRLSNYDRVRGAYEDDLREYLQWFKNRHDGTNTEADRTVNAPPFPVIDLSAIPAAAGQKGGVDGDSSNPTLLISQLENALSFWIEALTDLHRAVLSVVDFLAFVEAHTRAEAAAARADDVIAEFKYIQQDEMNNRLPGVRPDMSHPPGAVRKAASDACRRELADMDKSRLTHLRSMEEVQSQLMDALQRGGAQVDTSGMAAFSLRPGMRDSSGSVGAGGVSSGSGSRGGAGGSGSTGSGGLNEAAPPPPPERDRYKFIKTVEDRAGSGEEWVGECLAWFIELGEYIHALIGASIEAHEHDTRSVLEAMAKRRLGSPLTQEQLMVVMAPAAVGKGSSGNSSGNGAGAANGKLAGGSELRRRNVDWYNKLKTEGGAGGGRGDVDPELGTSDLVSNEDILRAQGRSAADLAYPRGGQPGGEGEARQAGDTQPQDPDMCKEEILAWQQVILLRSRLLTRPRGIGAMVLGHLDILLLTFDSFSKPLMPESGPSFMGISAYQLEAAMADTRKERHLFSRDSVPPMLSAETRAPRRAGQMEKVSDYITDTEWRRAFTTKRNAMTDVRGRNIVLHEANWTCRPFIPSMERPRQPVEHLHDARVHSPPAFCTELSPMRVVLEKLSTAYNMSYSALRTIMRQGPSSSSSGGTGVGVGGTGQDSLRLPSAEVQAAGRAAAAAMDAETTPLLSEAERQGYSRLPDSDDWDTSVARAPPPAATAATPVDAMVDAAGGLNSVVTGPLFKYLDIQPVLDCYETCMQLSRQALLESFKAHLPPLTGEKPVNFQLLSSQLWYSAVEFNHRLATLRGRIAAVVAKRDATDKTAWLQPSPLVPNLINLQTAAEAPLQDVEKNKDSSPADVEAGCTHTQWELRWDEDSSASAHRKLLVWGEERVKEPPSVPEAQAGASDEVSGTDAEGVVVPICVPLLEPEAIALALQLESVLQEAAAKLVCMPSMVAPGLNWLAAEYVAEAGHYDAPLADKLAKVKLISKPFTEDRNLFIEKSGPTARTRLADLWRSTEEDFILQCADPRTGARWYPYSYAYARLIYIPSDAYARIREKFLEDSPDRKVRRVAPMPSDKGGSDVSRAMEAELKILRREPQNGSSPSPDYLLFESQYQRYDLEARSERFMGVPLVGCTDYRQFKQGYIRSMLAHQSKYMEGAFERELKPFGSGQMFRSLWVEMPVSDREKTWHRAPPAGTDIPRTVPGYERIDTFLPETQQTSIENDDRDGCEREVSRFLPRARGIVNNGIHLSWPPEEFHLDPAATIRDHPIVPSTVSHQHPNTWSSTAVVRQDAPSDFLEWASRVDDTTRRTSYVWTKMWARLVSTYSAVMRAWYGLTTYVSVGTLRRPMLCLGTSVTDKRIEAVIREALRVQLLDEATQLAADSLISEEINDTTAESTGKKGAKKSKAKAAGGNAAAASASSSAEVPTPPAPATPAEPPPPLEAPAPPPPAPPARVAERPAATSTGKGKGSSTSTAAPTPAPVIASASASSAASSFVSAQGSTGRTTTTHTTMKAEEEEAEWERAGPASKGKAAAPASASSSGTKQAREAPSAGGKGDGASAAKPTTSQPGKDKVKQETGSRKNAEASRPVAPAPSAAAPSGPVKVTPAAVPAATARAPGGTETAVQKDKDKPTEKASAAAAPAAAPPATTAKASGKPLSFAAALSAPKTASAPVPTPSVPPPVPPQAPSQVEVAAAPSSKASAGSASLPVSQAPSAAPPAVVVEADLKVDTADAAQSSAAAAGVSANDNAAATSSGLQDSGVAEHKQADAAAAKQSESSSKRKPLVLRADSTPFLPPAATAAGSADTLSSLPPAVFAPGGTVPVQAVPVMLPAGMVPGFVPSLVAPMVMSPPPPMIAAAPSAALPAVPTGGATAGLQQQRMMGTFQGQISHGVQQGSVPTPVTPLSSGIPGNAPSGVAAGSAPVGGEGAQPVVLQQAPPSAALQPQGQMQNVQQQMMQQQQHQQQQQLMYMQYMQAIQAQAMAAQHQQAVAQGQAHAAGKAAVPGPSPSPSADGAVGQAPSGAPDARSSPSTLSSSPLRQGQGSTAQMLAQPMPAALQGQGARSVPVAAPFVPAPGSGQMPGASMPRPVGMPPGAPNAPGVSQQGPPMQPAIGQMMSQGQQQTPRGPPAAMQVPSTIMAAGPRGPVSIPVPPQIQQQLSSMQASGAYLAGELAQMNQMGQAQAAAGFVSNQFVQLYQAKQAQLTMVQGSFQALLAQVHQMAQAQAQGQLQAMPGQQIQGQLQGQGATVGPAGGEGGADASAASNSSAPNTSSQPSSSSSDVAAAAGTSGPMPTAADTSSGGSSQAQGGSASQGQGKKAWAAVAGGGSSGTPAAPTFSGAKYMPSTDKDAQVAAALQAREDAAAAESLSFTAPPAAQGENAGTGDAEEQGEWETQGGKKAKAGSKQGGKDSRGGTGSSSRGSVGGAGQGSGSRRGSSAAGYAAGGTTGGSASTDSVGLSNRYGANNCYLNTVAQALYRLTAYRSAVQARYPRLVEGYKGPKPGQRGPGSDKEGAAAELLAAVLHTFAGMDAAATGAGHAPAVSSVEPLKRALIRYLDARSGSSSGSGGLEQQLSTSAMGDAAETFEEVITLAHEAEVLVSRALRAGGSGKGGASLEDELALDLPVSPDTPAPSAALEAFGMVQQESVQCSECKHVANSSSFTGLGLLCNVADLVRLKRPLTSAGPHFDTYLREVSEGSETRTCPMCREATGATRQLKCHRVLRRATKVVSVVLGWASPREPSHVLSSCLDMLDGLLDLRCVFHGMEGLPVQPAKLKAMICYTELHWVAFFATEQGKWLCVNDDLVFSVESPIVECRAAGLQPSLLFYESQLPGDPFPAHRGRPALHGAAAPAVNAAAVAAQSPALPSRAGVSSGLGEGWPPVTIVNKPLSALHHGHEGSWGDMMLDAGNGLDAEEDEATSPGRSAGVGSGGPAAAGGGGSPASRTGGAGTASHGGSHSSSSRQAGGWAVRGGGGPGPRPAAGPSSGPRSSQGSSGGGPRDRYQYQGGVAGAAPGPGAAAMHTSGGPAPPNLQFQGGASRGGQGSRGSYQGGRGSTTPTGGSTTPLPSGGTPRASSSLAGGHGAQNSPDRAAQGGSWRGTSSWASQRSAGNSQSGAPAQ